MEDAGWNRMTDAIEAKFGLKSHGRSKRPVEDAKDLTEEVAFVIFQRDGEEYMLERVTGPAIIERKTFGAKRAGSALRYENVYDPEEIGHRTNFYRKAGDDWELLDPSAMQL
jgi:hypothetical protein